MPLKHLCRRTVAQREKELVPGRSSLMRSVLPSGGSVYPRPNADVNRYTLAISFI